MPSQPGEPRDETSVEAANDTQQPDEAELEQPVPDEAELEQPVPDEAELERTAQPATVRRAPKFSAFITFGALGGMVLGLLIALIVQPGPTGTAGGAGLIGFLDGDGSVRAILVATGGVVGAFVGGALAVRADRRSRPPRIGS